MSLQERALQHQFFRNLVFDEYFIYGPSFKKVLNKYGYEVENYNVIGVPRAFDMAKERNINEDKYAWLKQIKEQYSLVCCLALLPINDDHTKLYGSCGVSIKSNNDFLSDILSLAELHSDLYFLIRFKMDFDLSMLDAKLLKKIDQVDNMGINWNLTDLLTYDVMHFSDMIIGKQTSALEEAISAGKPVIYHDTEYYVASYNYFVNDLGIVSNSLLQTNAMVTSWENDNFDTKKINSYKQKYLNFPESDPYAIIRDRICLLL